MKYKIRVEKSVKTAEELIKLYKDLESFGFNPRFYILLDKKDLEECYKILKENPGKKYTPKKLMEILLERGEESEKGIKKQIYFSKKDVLHRQIGNYLKKRKKEGIRWRYIGNTPYFWYVK